MARISRIVVPGYPHHVTQRGVRSMEVFHRDEERHAYLRFLAEEAGRFDVDILCWCLMSNHVHVIAVPHQETSLARAFGEAHRRYTRWKNFAEGVRGYLFQGRFNSCVLDEDHLLSAARYVELNPVRVGMVKHAWGYPWSSARYHTGVSEIDPLVKDRTLLGWITDWKEFLGSGDDQATVRLRLATRTGRPAGGEEFIALVEGLTGRDLRKGPPGRPRKSQA